LFLLLFFCSAAILYQSIFTIATTLIEHKLHDFFRNELVLSVSAAKLLIQSWLGKIKDKFAKIKKLKKIELLLK
jgi:hypothetical protein